MKIITQSLSIKANFEVYEEDPKQGQIETHKKILDENGEDENVVFQKTVDELLEEADSDLIITANLEVKPKHNEIENIKHSNERMKEIKN